MTAEYMMTNRSVNVNSYLMYVAIGEDQKWNSMLGYLENCQTLAALRLGCSQCSSNVVLTFHKAGAMQIYFKGV